MHWHAKCKVLYMLLLEVLSNTVTAALKYKRNSETQETTRFCRMFNKFFDCLNVRSLEEHVHKRNPDIRPYRSPTDPQLQVSHVHSS